jgi:hypothetical protein
MSPDRVNGIKSVYNNHASVKPRRERAGFLEKSTFPYHMPPTSEERNPI